MTPRIRQGGIIDGRSSIWRVLSYLHLKGVIPGESAITCLRSLQHRLEFVY
jgi:hypothetical protein